MGKRSKHNLGRFLFHIYKLSDKTTDKKPFFTVSGCKPLIHSTRLFYTSSNFCSII